jgi:hypothetical protein
VRLHGCQQRGGEVVQGLVDGKQDHARAGSGAGLPARRGTGAGDGGANGGGQLPAADDLGDLEPGGSLVARA